MNPRSNNPKATAAIRGLLHMQIREMMSVSTAVRYAIVFIAISGLLAFINAQSNRNVFWDISNNLFVLGFLPYFCIVKGAESLRSELREGTIEFLWTRPARKASLFFGFYLSSLASTLATTFICVLAILSTGLWLGEISSFSQIAVYVGACAATTLSFSAISIAIGSITSKFIVFGIIYHTLIEKLVGQLPTSVRHLSVIGNLRPYLDSITSGVSDSAITIQPLFNIGLVSIVSLLLGATLFTWKSYPFGSGK